LAASGACSERGGTQYVRGEDAHINSLLSWL